MESPTPRSRRDVLRTLGAAATLPALSGVASAQSTAQDDYGPLGRVEVPGTTEVVVSGDVAYLATSDGFASVDVSDPENPSVLANPTDLLADRENGPMKQIFDVKVEGDRLLVAGPAQSTQNSVSALVLYDVSDPAAPEQVGVYETESINHNVFLSDGVAYRGDNYADGLQSENPVVMIDVEAGEELGRWSPVDENEAWGDVYTGLRVLHDMYVQDGVAYLAYWDAGTWLLDVSDPASPSVINHVRGRPPEELASLSGSQVTNENLQPPGNDHYVAVNDDASVLGVGMESWDTEADEDDDGPSGIELFDISDPTTAESLATITPPPTDQPTYSGVWTTSHNFDFAGDRLYTSWYSGGVKVFDVSDPSAPGILREWENREELSFWAAVAVEPGETFVASAENHRGEQGAFAGLVAFPDAPSGEQSTRTQTPVPTSTTDSTTGTANGTGDGGNTTGGTASGGTTTNGTGTVVSDTTVAATDSGTVETTTDSSGSGPGFGIAAGVAGSGLAAWRVLRGQDDDE
ncbi:LVIVD repeat-containing protein [Halomarina salina]|uniref:LVIVD repeat-containing protein n=1 Tax=Halomarina salina TaxID=1872699 RepID=A0ABD5RJU0_9EURY|nr:hypothetical protein [Halomarina salina]